MFSESSIISKWVQFKVRMLLKEKSMGGPSSASSLLFYLSSLTFFWLAYCFISIYSQFYWIIYYGVQAKYPITAHSRIPFCVPIRLTRNIINMQTQQQNQYPRPNLTALHPPYARTQTIMIAHNVVSYHEDDASSSFQNQSLQPQFRKTFPRKSSNDGVGTTRFGSIKKNQRLDDKETNHSRELSPNHPIHYGDDERLKAKPEQQPGVSSANVRIYKHEFLQRPLQLLEKRKQTERERISELKLKNEQRKLNQKVRSRGNQQQEINKYFDNNSEQQEFMVGEEISLYPDSKSSRQANQKANQKTNKAKLAEGQDKSRSQQEKRLYQNFGITPQRSKMGTHQHHNINNYLKTQNALVQYDNKQRTNNSNTSHQNSQSNNQENQKSQLRSSPKLRHHQSYDNPNQFVDSRQLNLKSNGARYGPGGIQTLQFNTQKEKLIILDSKQTDNNANPQNNLSPQFCQNIVIPVLDVLPSLESTPQELVAISKNIFMHFGCKINEQTVINVRKYRNCVFFSINPENNILYHYDNGKLYYGGWKTLANGEGEKSGQGLEILPGRYKFKGYFIEGKKYGAGTLINNDGSAYVGQWENGMKHGSGRQLDADGIIYQGEWREGKRSGYGNLTNNGRLQFEGVFSKGLKNGYGRQYFENGDQYDGNYLNHKFEGKGTYLWQSGASYVGEFKHGKRNGVGLWKSGDNDFDSYQGEYVDDKKHGHGIYRWHNGATYEGEFREDVKHGKGTIIYENGKVAHLIWKNGKVQKKVAANEEKLSNLPASQNISKIKLPTRDRSTNSQPQIHLLQSQVHLQQEPKQKHNNAIFRSRVSSRSTQNLQSAASSSSSKNFPKGVAFRANSMNKLQQRQSRQGSKKSEPRTIRLKFENNELEKAIGVDWNKNLHVGSYRNGVKESTNKPDLPRDRPYQGIQNSANMNLDL